MIFRDWVYFEGAWDIKYQDPWNTTIGTVFPGHGATVRFGNMILTLEDLGNYTYGYIGAAMGLPLQALIGGSLYAHMKSDNGQSLKQEFADWKYILRGYYSYNS